MTHLNPKESREAWNVFSDTKPYQNMTKRQREIFDHGEANGLRGVKRYTEADIARWKEKRDSMTPEELEAYFAKEERKAKIAGACGLIAVCVLLAVCIVVCMKMVA